MSFSVGALRAAVALRRVIAVSSLSSIVRECGAEAVARMTIELRGAVLPLVDLHSVLGFGKRGIYCDSQGCVAFLQALASDGPSCLGLLACGLPAIVEFTAEDIRVPPRALRPVVIALAKKQGRTFPLLDVDVIGRCAGPPP